MKVLFLIESMTIESGGPAIEIAKILKGLSLDKDIKITLATITPFENSLYQDDNVSYFQIKSPSFLSFSWFKALFDIRKLIFENDVLFVTGIWGPIDGLALRISWLKNKILYIRVCGMLEPYILKRNVLKKKIGKFLYLDRNLEHATGIIVNSKSEAKNLVNFGVRSEKIKIIPNGVEINEKKDNIHIARKLVGLKDDRPILLYLGRIHPKKGLHVLVDAISRLPSEQRNFVLLVAGEYVDANFKCIIEEKIKLHKLEDMILFSGLVAGDIKNMHFVAADCFILPSESEGLPNAVLEAMTFGLPVILTEGCNIPEIKEYNAGCVTDFSVEGIYDALIWFIKNLNLLPIIGENSIKLVKDRFDQENSINEYKKIIYSHLKK